MSLVTVYDEQQVRRLAKDISELLILPEDDTTGYDQLARRLYGAGWRNTSEED